MSDQDTGVVLEALRASLQDVSAMRTPVEEIVAAGRTRRLRRRLLGAASGVVAVAGLVTAVSSFGVGSANAPGSSQASGAVHVRTVAFTLDTKKDGTIQVTWDKEQYFKDPAGLQTALTKAGFPVLIKVGEFCKGPQDNGALDPSGVDPRVDRVMKADRAPDGKVTFTFTPSAMPAGTELFIGYLSPSQLQVTHGRPGSVERLVPTGKTLTCTTQAPPPYPAQDKAPAPKG